MTGIHYPLRVVALGGGTGLPMVLRGLKTALFPQGADDPSRLMAVVTVTDEGGSSGRLRDELGVLPPGDVRNCLVALSHNEPLMARLFQARYRSSGPLNGHSIGNLILAGLAQMEGSGFLDAVRQVSEVLNIQGQVLPSTLTPTRLVARLDDGTEVVGETAISERLRSVASLRLDPAEPVATDGVADAIRRADILVIGPGSLYTSILPNLLIPEIAAAIGETPAFRLFVLNAMTEPGETRGFGAEDHLRAIVEHAAEPLVDAVLLASDEIPATTSERYRHEGAVRVAAAAERLGQLVPMVLSREILLVEPKVRHDPRRTAGAIIEGFTAWGESGFPRPQQHSAGAEGKTA
ncbi:MAG: YvcK family protein [Acidobacteriota bacterium]|nr:YvcK family protein [Acidobacteriota bacterium]